MPAHKNATRFAIVTNWTFHDSKVLIYYKINLLRPINYALFMEEDLLLRDFFFELLGGRNEYLFPFIKGFPLDSLNGNVFTEDLDFDFEPVATAYAARAKLPTKKR
jgi:hypothetical protein